MATKHQTKYTMDRMKQDQIGPWRNRHLSLKSRHWWRKFPLQYEAMVARKTHSGQISTLTHHDVLFGARFTDSFGLGCQFLPYTNRKRKICFLKWVNLTSLPSSHENMQNVLKTPNNILLRAIIDKYCFKNIFRITPFKYTDNYMSKYALQ